MDFLDVLSFLNLNIIVCFQRIHFVFVLSVNEKRMLKISIMIVGLFISNLILVFRAHLFRLC